MWAGYSEHYLPNATKPARARVLVSKHQTSKHFGLWLQNCTFNPTRLKITKKKKKKGHITSPASTWATSCCHYASGQARLPTSEQGVMVTGRRLPGQRPLLWARGCVDLRSLAP